MRHDSESEPSAWDCSESGWHKGSLGMLRLRRLADLNPAPSNLWACPHLFSFEVGLSLRSTRSHAMRYRIWCTFPLPNMVVYKDDNSSDIIMTSIAFNLSLGMHKG